MTDKLKVAPKKKAATAAPKRTRKPAEGSTATAVLDLSHEQIAARARELYERAGSPGGRDEEFWLEAERQLRGEMKL